MSRLKHLSNKIKLDSKDFKIIKELQTDSRMPLSKICKKVGLSRDGVDYRIKQLVKKEVITLFYPMINYSSLGYNIFHIFFLVDESQPKDISRFYSFLKSHNNVMSVIEYNDKWNLEVFILAKNLVDFDQILIKIMNEFPKLILDKESLAIIKEYVNNFIPIKTEKSIENIDDTDKNLLGELSKNCRLSSYELGTKLKVSHDSINYRIKNLKSKGIIRFYSSTTNMSALNHGLYACVISLKKFDIKDESKMAEITRNHPKLIQAVKTLGSWDIILYVVAKDSVEFHKTMKDIKIQLSDIIKDYDVWLAYEELYYNPFPNVLKSLN